MQASLLAEILREEIRGLSAYAPHPGSFGVRLDANEAPPLLPPAALERLAAVAAETDYARYPDATCWALRESIARTLGVGTDEVLAGTGSDEVIALLLTVFSRARGRAPAATVVTTTPSFVMYRMSAQVRGLKVVEVPLDDGWDLATESMRRAIEMGQPNLIFIASPNNPTAGAMSRDRIEAVVKAAPGALVVLDEAYVAYADSNLVSLYREHENVVLLRTLSKVGFAALRVGWLVARPSIVREVDKARQPYNVSVPSQRLARLVLDELGDEVASVVATVRSERERVSAAVARLPGLTVAPSQANFLWIATAGPAAQIFEGLAARGVLVRSFHSRGGRLARQIRVTIGTPAENDAFLRALGEVTC